MIAFFFVGAIGRTAFAPLSDGVGLSVVIV
jgi:hypothetical protein